jgi:hypothetical protein
MEKTSKNIYVTYEPEADILSWEITKDPIEYAEEVGNMIVHFSKKHIPVFVEVLNAKSFLTKTNRMAHRKTRQTVSRRVVV